MIDVRAPRARSSSSVTDVGFGEAELDEFLSNVEKAKPESPLPRQPLSRLGRLRSFLCSAAVRHSATYSFFSISMTLVNKLILTSFKFDYHMALLLYQNGTCVVLLLLARYFGLASFERLDSRRLAAWIPLNLLFVMMLLTGFFSLNLLSVPMATIFKNSTNLLITLGDYLVYGQTVRRGILLSLLLMLTGAVLAGHSDLEFNLLGYLWAAANCVITAAYVLYMPRAITDSNLNAFGRVYYNNLLSLPLVLVVDLAVYNDLNRMLHDRNAVGSNAVWIEKPGFLFAITFSGCIGFFLSLTSFQCVHSTSPTTYAMIGAMNKIPLAILGVVIFKTQLNARSAVFISLSLLAGILYAHTKSREGAQRPKK